jgi:hypothetical protein
MRRILLFISAVLIVLSSVSQTPANFNCNDCSGNNHDLFAELNSGKVVVITWVMPCTNCTAKAVTAHNAVQSFSTSNPGQIVYYIADDYADTPCSSLQLWSDTSVALNIKTFSNASVSMSPYGTAGMPKTIVLGGTTTHSVYFNQNGGAANNLTGIQTAISQATMDILAGIKENSMSNYQTKLSPNPAQNEISLSFELKQTEQISIEIYNLIGAKLKQIENSPIIGKNEIKINTESLSNGTYFLKINNGKTSDTVKFIIAK